MTKRTAECASCYSPRSLHGLQQYDTGCWTFPDIYNTARRSPPPFCGSRFTLCPPRIHSAIITWKLPPPAINEIQCLTGGRLVICYVNVQCLYLEAGWCINGLLDHTAPPDVMWRSRRVGRCELNSRRLCMAGNFKSWTRSEYLKTDEPMTNYSSCSTFPQTVADCHRLN